MEQASTDLQHMGRYARGAEAAILRGDLDIQKIQAAEIQATDLP